MSVKIIYIFFFNNHEVLNKNIGHILEAYSFLILCTRNIFHILILMRVELKNENFLFFLILILKILNMKVLACFYIFVSVR